VQCITVFLFYVSNTKYKVASSCFSKVKDSFPGASNKLDEWLSMRFFSVG